jgi:LAS superfamily LD-carboxypeptidase LdcB
LDWPAQIEHHRVVRALVISLAVCLLAGTAAADEQPRIAKGYRDGKPQRIRVVDVDGIDVEVATAQAFREMQRAAAADGITLTIQSGFRTNERQAELYRAYKQGVGNLAARPGHSNHQLGRALDIVLDATNYPWLQTNARAHGFYRTVPSETWHWEFLGVPKKRAARPAQPRQR